MMRCLLALIALSLLWMACDAGPSYPRVSLAEPRPSPTPATTGEARPFRVAIAAVISPQSTVEEYLPFLDYLEQRLGRPVELVQRRTYAEVNALVRDREVDLALVCTGAYIRGHRDFGMELLAVPQVQGETVYYSYVIVPASSPAHSLADLRGKSFAFTDPLSNSGRLMVLYMLLQMREEPGLFFGRTLYTYSHDNSIRAVVDGLVDGAAVDSLVYTYFLSRHPELASRVRLIARSEPCAMPPVVVHPAMEAEEKAFLQNLLLTMHQDEEGRAVLAGLMIDRFVALDDRAYDSVRRALEAVERVP